MNKDKSIDVLNKLIENNNDRIEGYETASKETEEKDLKILFAGFITTSQKCKQELVQQVLALGGTPEEGTRITGKFFRVWMDVKAALTKKDRKAILKSCEYGEDVAIETYEKVLSDPDIPSNLVTLIKSQHLRIKNDHDKINPKTSKFINLILVLVLGLSVSSCSVVGGIFKTGMDVGIFITVAVIVLVIILILRMRRRSN